MKQRLQTKAKAIINHPQTQLALASLKTPLRVYFSPSFYARMVYLIIRILK